MANRSKQIGTKAETKVKRYFQAHGLECERRALAGSDDEGDLRLVLRDGSEVTVEVKAGKQTANYNRSKLREWMRQTTAESLNRGCPGILVIVRYRRDFDDAEVWIPTEEWGMLGWVMVHIDDYADTIGG